MIHYGAATEADLPKILALQQANLPKAISAAEALEQGFLTVEHDLSLLGDMNDACAHTIAKAGDDLAGYVLSMTRDFSGRIPILVPLFELIDTLSWKGRSVLDVPYILMGQVCVAKAHRGQGVFKGLYREMQKRMAANFELIITEISTRNTRSIRAHQKVGFVDMHRYQAPDGENWVVVGLETGVS
ncbi:MAG: GNAT family N-acetyltransferase [Bacteroidota bacterium]